MVRLLLFFLLFSFSLFGEDCENDLSHPLSIAELIDIGLQNNPTTQKTWADARAAYFGVGVAQSSLYPFVTFTETGSTQNVETRGRRRSGGDVISGVPVSKGSSETLTSDLAISYLLLDFGGRNALICGAKQALYAARWTHDQAIQRVILNVLTAYYNYLQTVALRDAQKLDLENAQKNYDSANAMLEAGVKTRLDMLQAKSNLVSSQKKLVDLEGQVKTALGTLAKEVGLPSNTPIQVAPFPQELPVEEITEDVNELIEEAKVERADLAAAISDMYQKEENIRIAYSASMPSLTTQANLERTDYTHSPIKQSHAYQGSLSLNIPLFTGFLWENEIHQAQSEWYASYAAWEELEQQVMLDVLVNYYAFKTAIEDVKFSEEYLKYAQEAYEAAFAQYKTGTASILDLLSTQLTLANARAQQIESRAQWITALSNLVYSIGRL